MIGPWCEGAIAEADIGLTIAGIGPVGLPLRPAGVRKLSTVASQVPYGKRTETIIDTTVATHSKSAIPKGTSISLPLEKTGHHDVTSKSSRPFRDITVQDPEMDHTYRHSTGTQVRFHGSFETSARVGDIVCQSSGLVS